MSENNNARATFDTLCLALDNMDWKYNKHEEDLTVTCGAQGDDLPIEFVIDVNEKRELVILLSQMPYTIEEGKRLELAIAISAVNNMIVDGCFDYNVKTGKIVFRMTNCFADSVLHDEVFAYMMLISSKTIDEYNDKFFMIGKGMLSLEQFLSSLKND